MEINVDSRIIDTPLNQEYASVGRRFLAFLLDGLILLIPSAILGGLLPVIGGLVVWFFYGPILESSDVRATIGKHLMGLQVADVNGGKITLKAAIIRNALKIVSVAVLLVGCVMAFFTKRKQSLHDMLADTVVVYGRSETNIADAWLENTKATFSLISGEIKSNTSRGSSQSVAAQLEHLFSLKAKGALTEEEYEKAKRKVLGE